MHSLRFFVIGDEGQNDEGEARDHPCQEGNPQIDEDRASYPPTGNGKSVYGKVWEKRGLIF